MVFFAQVPASNRSEINSLYEGMKAKIRFKLATVRTKLKYIRLYVLLLGSRYSVAWHLRVPNSMPVIPIDNGGKVPRFAELGASRYTL